MSQRPVIELFNRWTKHGDCWPVVPLFGLAPLMNPLTAMSNMELVNLRGFKHRAHRSTLPDELKSVFRSIHLELLLWPPADFDALIDSNDAYLNVMIVDGTILFHGTFGCRHVNGPSYSLGHRTAHTCTICGQIRLEPTT